MFCRVVGLAAVGFLAAGIARADTLALCGEAAGQAFYPPGGVVAKNESGWMRDKIGGGRTTLSKDKNGNYDITFADASGGVYSSRAEGAAIVPVVVSPNAAIFIAAYAGKSVEVYQFVRDSSGVQRLLQTQSKSLGVLNKAGLYVSECSAMNLK